MKDQRAQNGLKWTKVGVKFLRMRKVSAILAEASNLIHDPRTTGGPGEGEKGEGRVGNSGDLELMVAATTRG